MIMIMKNKFVKMRFGQMTKHILKGKGVSYAQLRLQEDVIIKIKRHFHCQCSVLRPCVRQNFPHFLFWRVSEQFGFRSSEIFWKYLVFSNSQKFCENSSEISSEISSEKISCFWVKKPVFEGFGVKVQKIGSKTGVSKHSKFMENSEFVLF